jgi:hypothetical protein
MALFTVEDARAWGEPTKLPMVELQADLSAQVETHVLARLGSEYAVNDWSTSSNTPKLVRSLMAMYYVAWLYERAHAEDDPASEYSLRLLAMAERALTSILDGSMVLVDLADEAQHVGGQGSTEVSDPVFTMGRVF